jgi:predicted MarR family transcription regulator
MADIGSFLPVPLQNVQETQEMKMKWLEIKKQEKISQIAHLNQAIEDLRKGKMAEIEYALMKAQAELAEVERVEKMVKNSTETTAL